MQTASLVRRSSSEAVASDRRDMRGSKLRPHPEEHRVAMRLEGWNESVPGSILRDGRAQARPPQDEVVDYVTSANAGHDPAFGAYVHWPFCRSKCPYCDFNSHVRHGLIDQPRFVRAFTAEIAATAARTPGRTVSTIFLGGGTPSLMEPATVAAILDAVANNWHVADDVEVTLEANPTSVEAQRFAGYRAAGVNRVSLGGQALDDAALAALGRTHTAREALGAVAIARRIFQRYSFDLIYARPDQTAAEWRGADISAGSEAARHRSLSHLPNHELATHPALQPPG